MGQKIVELAHARSRHMEMSRVWTNCKGIGYIILSTSCFQYYKWGILKELTLHAITYTNFYHWLSCFAFTRSIATTAQACIYIQLIYFQLSNYVQRLQLRLAMGRLVHNQFHAFSYFMSKILKSNSICIRIRIPFRIMLNQS